MKAIEVTIHNLISSGMDPKTENNAYLGFIYTSFQERATKVRPARSTAQWAMSQQLDKRSVQRRSALLGAALAGKQARLEAYRIAARLIVTSRAGQMRRFCWCSLTWQVCADAW